MPIFKISNHELAEDLVGDAKEFPKYTSQLMNLANQNSQGTRPRIVGQMSDLIQEFGGKKFDEWVIWYTNRMPTAVTDATEKIYGMVKKLQKAIELIDKDMVQEWAKDLILTKTFVGLCFQESILIKVASLKNANYRLATPQEESAGIDGYVGKNPVSIKPVTYKTKGMYAEQIDADLIYYDKKKDGILIEFDF